MIDTLKQRIGFNPLAWLRHTRRMRKLVRDFDASAAATAGALRFAVVVPPWLGSGVPWFSLAVGLLLARNGNNVTFIVDDLPFGNNAVRYGFVIRCIRAVFRLLRAQHAVIDLSAVRGESALDDSGRSLVERLARLNAVWELRGESVDGRRQSFTALCVKQLSRAYGPISRVMRPGAFDVIFMPGGIYGSSGLWAAHARAAGIRIASYDNGGFGASMLAVNGIACQLHDIPAAYRLLKDRSADHEERAFAIESAAAEIDRRRAGVDTFASQVKGSGSGDSRYDGAVLIALNSSWDSAALGLHTIFEDNQQWIVETARYLLENTSVPVVVRQHPAERLSYARSNDDYRGLLQRNFGSHPRLHFVAAEEKINSYALFDRVAAVVVYTSTIGVEAAAHGKPVITPSNSYYSGLGFVWRAADLDQYQAYLASAASGALAVTPAMRDDAMLCYYITQVCNWVFSPFNPADFRKWSRLDLDKLHADAKVQGALKALQESVPIAFLNHLERLAEHRKSMVSTAA